MIYGMKNKNLTFVKIATVGLVSLMTSAIVLDIAYNLKNLRYAYLCLVTPLPLTIGILSDSDSVSERISTIITLYGNGQSNTPGPAAGSGSGATGSGSGATGAGSGATGSGRGAGGSLPTLLSFSNLLASTNNVPDPAGSLDEPAGSALNLPSFSGASGPASGSASGSAVAGTPAQSTLGIEDTCYGNSKTDLELDNLFGPDRDTQQINGVCDKMAVQRININRAKYIYGNYPANATLSLEDKKAIARQILGWREGYVAVNRGTLTNPDYRVGKMGSYNNFESLKNSRNIVEKLRRRF